MVKVIVHEKYVELTSNVFEKFTTLPNEKIPIEKISFVSNGFLKSYWYNRDIRIFDSRKNNVDILGRRYRVGIFTSHDGDKEYWNVYEKQYDGYLVIELENFEYRRILLTIRDNVKIKEQIEKLIRKDNLCPVPRTDPYQDKRIFYQRTSSNVLWYLLPIFFGIFGGVIAYFILKDDESRKAKVCLFIGIGLSGIGFGMMALLFIVIS